MKERLPQLRVGTGWISIRVISEPDVVLTFRGYAPILAVKEERTGLEYTLYITAKSLAEPLEALRTDNGGNFTGLTFRIRKETDEPMSRYELQA